MELGNRVSYHNNVLGNVVNVSVFPLSLVFSSECALVERARIFSFGNLQGP